jgi:hypothetical protein
MGFLSWILGNDGCGGGGFMMIIIMMPVVYAFTRMLGKLETRNVPFLKIRTCFNFNLKSCAFVESYTS